MGRQGPPGAADDFIRSPSNRTLKLIRSLRQRKSRETERAFVVEGFRAIADGVAAGARPILVAIREGEELAASHWFGSELPLRSVEAALFEDVAETVTPQGALAVFPWPDLRIPRVDDPLYLILDQVRDPGNLGTLLRTAAAAGATAVFVTEGTVDPFNPKAVRAAVGAHFRIPIRWLTDEDRRQLERDCPVRVVADATASSAYEAIDWTAATALIIGSEAHGAGGIGRGLGTMTARIPLAANVESLNAAAAGAVFLFEAARQRRLKAESTGPAI
ncbi:MAG: methyltransferase, TrmH family [Thermomicrobiales bacterium]|nr:methyltransferase, TrmH family [Thermomicrobiales bacterium]